MTMPLSDSPSEDEIVEGCRQGRDWARRALFDQHHKAVYHVLLAKSGDAAEAEELAQDAFLRAYRTIGDYRGSGKVRSWLIRIAVNAFYDRKRRETTYRRKLRTLRAGPEETAPEPPSSLLEDPEESAGRRELGELLWRALERLDGDRRDVVVLHDVQGHTYAEVAEILGIPRGTVASRLSRAHVELREILADVLGDDGIRKLASFVLKDEEEG